MTYSVMESCKRKSLPVIFRSTNDITNHLGNDDDLLEGGKQSGDMVFADTGNFSTVYRNLDCKPFSFAYKEWGEASKCIQNDDSSLMLTPEETETTCNTTACGRKHSNIASCPCGHTVDDVASQPNPTYRHFLSACMTECAADLQEKWSCTSSSFRSVPALPIGRDICYCKHKPTTAKTSSISMTDVTRSETCDVDRYLCELFSTMRNGMAREFAVGAIEYSEFQSSKPHATPAVMKLPHFFVYTAVDVSGLPQHENSRLFLHFKVHVPKQLKLKQSERLTNGTVVCLTDSKPENFALASVIEKKCVSDYWILTVALESSECGQESFNSLVVLEPEKSYALHKATLACLQRVNSENRVLQEIVELSHGSDKTNRNGKLTEYAETSRTWINMNGKELDESQKNAFNCALSRRVTVVHGPPGSGKTYLGVKFVQFFSNSNKLPALVLCQSNTCLDHFLEKVLPVTSKVVRLGEGCKSADLIPHTITAISDVISTSLGIFRKGPNYVYSPESMENENSLDENGKRAVNKIINELGGGVQLQDILAGNRTLLRNVQKLEKQKFILQALKSCHFTEDILKMMIPAMCSLRQYGDLKQAFRHWLHLIPSEVGTYETIDELASAVHRTKIRVKRYLASFQNDQPGVDGDDRFDEICRSLAFEIINWKDDVYDSMPSNIEQLRLEERWRLCRTWRAELKRFLDDSVDFLQRSCETFRDSYLEATRDYCSKLICGASVVGTTSQDLLQNWEVLQKLNPRTVLVEEAAQVPESSIILSLARETKCLVLLEDSVYFMSDCPDEASFLGRGRNTSEFMKPIPNERLLIQHRMRKNISDLLIYPCNSLSYPRHEETKEVEQNVYFLCHEIVENDTFIKETGKMLIELCKYFFHVDYDASQITILVNGSKLLSFLLKNMKHLGEKPVSVTTPDSFRGQENDIILVSFNGNSKREFTALKTVHEQHFMNTCLSRSRRILYCIGDFEFFAAQDHQWRDLIEHLKSKDIFGDRLPLQCIMHREYVQYVSTADDIRKLRRPHCEEDCRISLQVAKLAAAEAKVPSNGGSTVLYCDKTDLQTLSAVSAEEDSGIEYGQPNRLRHGIMQHGRCPKTSTESQRNDCEQYPKCSRNSSVVDVESRGMQSSPVIPSRASVDVGQFGNDDCSVDNGTPPLGGEQSGNRAAADIGPQSVTNTYEKGGATSKCLQNDGNSVVSLFPEELDVASTSSARASDRSTVANSPCGHEVAVVPGHCNPTHRDLLLACRRECGAALRCGHRCAGKCGKCRYYGIHDFCHERCDKVLDCGHPCDGWCGAPCPPCANNPCPYRCPHGRCEAACQEECIPCMQPCTWVCEHYRCGRLCHEECDRPPCDRPCDKLLCCGHPCLGFCGEPCPPVCLECNRSDVSPGTGRLVVLEDCGHVVGERTVTNCLPESSLLQPPKCPECGLNINWNRRFANVVKDWFTKVPIYRETYHELLNILRNAVKTLFANIFRLGNFDNHLSILEKIETPSVEVLKLNLKNLNLLENVLLDVEFITDRYFSEWILSWIICHLGTVTWQQVEECEQFIRRLRV